MSKTMNKALSAQLGDDFGLTELTELFEQDVLPERDLYMPVPYTETSDKTFWTDPKERSRYKLGRDGDPLPVSLEVESGSDYDDGLSIAHDMTNDDDTGISLSDYLNTH